MKALSTALAVLTWAVVSSVQAQSADEIVTRYFNAIGGKEKIANINTLYQEQTVEVMNNHASSTTIIVNGKGFKNEIDFGGQKIVNCFTDKGGWSINPMLGQSTPTPMNEDQFNAGKEQLDIGGPLMNYASKGNKVELAGKENLNGIEAIKVKVTTTGNVESIYFFDPKTYYLLRNVSKVNVNGQDFETAIIFSDYRKTHYGNMLPYSVEMSLPQGFTVKTNVTKVEVNKPIDEKVFKAE